MQRKNLTQNQHKLLQFIAEYQERYQVSPTLREMVTALGVRDNKSVLGIIQALVERGYLARGQQRFRSVMLTSAAREQIGEAHNARKQPVALIVSAPLQLDRRETSNVQVSSYSVAYAPHTFDTNGTQ